MGLLAYLIQSTISNNYNQNNTGVVGIYYSRTMERIVARAFVMGS